MALGLPLNWALGIRMATYVIINGSFGVGKTTVARKLRALIPGSVIFDPEMIGFVIRRAPGYAYSDYQHSKLWRRLSIWGIRLAGLLRKVVIIPMTFSRSDYLDEFRNGLNVSGIPPLHFCLVAPVETVRERLKMRGEPESDSRWSWVHRRAAECCEAHKASVFATRISTVDITPDEIAVQLLMKINTSDGA